MKKFCLDADKYSQDVIESAGKLYSDMVSKKMVEKMLENNLVIERLLACIKSFKSPSVKMVYDFYFEKKSVEELAKKYGVSIPSVETRLFLGKSMLARQQSKERWFLVKEHCFKKELLEL